MKIGKNCEVLQLPTGQIKMQLKRTDTEKYVIFTLQLPTGQIKMQLALVFVLDESIQNRVATPHGSDKNATYNKISKGGGKMVATPHGSDKNATLLFKPLKDKD